MCKRIDQKFDSLIIADFIRYDDFSDALSQIYFYCNRRVRQTVKISLDRQRNFYDEFIVRLSPIFRAVGKFRRLSLRGRSLCIGGLSLCVGRLSLCIGRLSLRIGRLRLHVNKLNLSINRLSLHVGRLSLSVGKLSLHIDKLNLSVSN